MCVEVRKKYDLFANLSKWGALVSERDDEKLSNDLVREITENVYYLNVDSSSNTALIGDLLKSSKKLLKQLFKQEKGLFIYYNHKNGSVTIGIKYLKMFSKNFINMQDFEKDRVVMRDFVNNELTLIVLSWCSDLPNMPYCNLDSEHFMELYMEHLTHQVEENGAIVSSFDNKFKNFLSDSEIIPNFEYSDYLYYVTKNNNHIIIHKR